MTSLESIDTGALEAELLKRREKARQDEVLRRDRISMALQEACNKIEGFKELLVPNPKSDLARAISGNLTDYEICLYAHYEPLKDARRD